MTSPGEITTLLAAARQGDRKAESDLIQIVYKDLHALAQRYMRRERSDHTLQATALVNEAYVRLIDSLDVQDRGHLFATAATVMRRILVDHARQRSAAKRNAGAPMAEFDDAVAASTPRYDQMLILDQALNRLAENDPRTARLVELIYFGGLSQAEAAATLDISSRQARRDWEEARAWLQAQLRQADE